MTILGLTFKENVPDTRNSRVIDIVRELQVFRRSRCRSMIRWRTLPMPGTSMASTLTDCDALQPADAVILAVAHQPYVDGGWPLVQRLLRGGAGLVLDVKTKLDRAAKPAGIELWRL